MLFFLEIRFWILIDVIHWATILRNIVFLPFRFSQKFGYLILFIYLFTPPPHIRLTVKPGSHMPSSYLRHGRRSCLLYTTGTNEDIAPPATEKPPAWLRSWTRVNFAGMPAVKTDMASLVGDWSSHIRTASQAVPAAMSLVGRRHMRTRLQFEIDPSIRF